MVENYNSMDLAAFKNVWVFCEQRQGKMMPTTFELISEGRKLADELGVNLCGLLLGDNVEGIAKELGGYGADEVIVCEHPLLKNYTTDAYAKVICDVISEMKPEAFLIGATNIGRDLGPRCAARLHTGLCADCTHLDVDMPIYKDFLRSASTLPEEKIEKMNTAKVMGQDHDVSRDLKMTRPAFGGNLMATIICPRFRPAMATVRPGVMKKAPFDQAKADAVKITKPSFTLSEADMDTEVVEVVKAAKKLVDLIGADYIVSVGRGISKDVEGGIKLAEELADVLGGVVGGTYYSLNVTNCSNSGNVTGWRYCAGIVGNISSGNQPSTITGCVNTGSITAPSTCAAGIVSNLPNGCKVTACYNTGTIKAGGNYPAGIVGYCANSEVRSCFNLGTVTCNTTFTYGSVIGTVSSADAVIESLYYLEGTCEKGGIGAVKNAETQTAAVRTAEEIANAEFVSTMNADLAEAAFTSGCTATKHPILLWQADAEHTFANTASDVIKSEATCTEAAVYYVKCDNCDAVSNTLTVKVGEPLGHDLTVTVVEPTCEKDGYTESVCARCGLSYRTNYVAAKGHSYVDVVTAPTCESAGYTTHTCSVCGDSYVDAMLPATGHSYVDVVTAPTCESAGYTTHTCSVCGSSYVDTMTDALGHDYQTVVTAPTCDAMGYTTHTCTRCGNSYVDSYTQAADHSYTSEVTKQPTCTEEGVRTFTCTNCGKSYTESIPMIAHSYEAVRTDPDCTHMGYTTYTCSACGDSYKADFVDAAGHDCEATVAAPTCEGYGYTENHCKHCDYTYISEIRQPLGHDDKLTGAKDATCTEPGYTGDMVCTRCGELHSKGEEIPALGHDYGDWTTVKEADCFHTGLEERKCGRCGETEQRETTAETCLSEAYTDLDRNGWYHEYVDWVLKNGVMNGVGGGRFEPDGQLTRAQLVTVLYRAAGEPDTGKQVNPFTDVADDAWYTKAVIWAANNGIVNGVAKNTFAPDDSITREQIAAMLYRYAGAEAAKEDKLSAFPDAAKVSDWAKEALNWAVASGLINGVADANGTANLEPQATATRAQIATILMRWLEK